MNPGPPAPDNEANHDLRAIAPEAKASPIRFAFEFPELLDAFAPIDAQANRARQWSRTLGFWAIGLVLAALLLVSADPLLGRLGEEVQADAGYLAAGLGVLGSAIGLWSWRRGSARHKWLRARLQTELLRLFHFRYLAERLPEALAAIGDPSRVDAYRARRAEAYAGLRARVLDQPSAAYAKLLVDPEHAPLEGLIETAPADATPASADADAAFAAWRRQRLAWQLAYVDMKLTDGAPGGRPTPMRLEGLFAAVGWTCIAVIVGLDLLHFSESFLHLDREWLQLGTVATALVALAARALETGLAPQREVERYEQYRVNIKVAMERFDRAPTFAGKLEIMRAFEHTALEEMIVFIRTHARSHFLL